jgi:hypothetical protein
MAPSAWPVTEVCGPFCYLEAIATADTEKREAINLQNQAESLIYQAEKQLTDLGDKVGGDDKTKGESLSADLKAAVEKDDTAAITASLEQLQQWQRCGCRLQRRGDRCGGHREQGSPLRGRT